MPTAIVGADAIERYLLRLNAALLNEPAAEREEFLREIRAHIFERLEDSPDVPAILAAVGDPEELARQFRTETMLARSSRSWSAWVLMRTAARWALSGVQGFSIFLVAVIGYSVGASLYISAMLKPIFPDNVGIFVGGGHFSIGLDSSPRAHDISGPYFTLYAMVIGFACILGTTLALRAMMRKFAQVKSRFATGDGGAGSLPAASMATRDSIRDWSSLKLLRTAARWALSGVQGLIIFVLAVVGYVLGGTLWVTAALKPIYPGHIGVFVGGPEVFQLTAWPQPRGHDIAGPYYTAIAALVGFLIVAGTRLGLRFLMQNFARLKHHLA